MKLREGAFVVALAALAVCVVVLVALPPAPGNQTEVSTSPILSEGPLEFSSGVSPEGLQLKMMVNSSRMHSTGAIRAQIEVVNTLNRNVTVSELVQNDNVSRWIEHSYGCPSDAILYFAVFEGRFTAGNISAAGSPLRLGPQNFSNCPGSVGVTAVTFPHSGGQALGAISPSQPLRFFWKVATVINATTLVCNTTSSGNGGFNCSWANPGLLGYWNYNIPNGGNFGFTSPSFVRFSPGEYTIVAADDWNQYVYATFSVR
jgi:hypothetical protein